MAGSTRGAGGLDEDTLQFVCRWRVLEFSGGVQEALGTRCYLLRNLFLQDVETLLHSRSHPLHLLRLPNRTDGAAEITLLRPDWEPEKLFTFTFTFV